MTPCDEKVSIMRGELERLKRDSQLLELYLEKAPVYVFFKDADTRSLRLSRNYETMLGKPLNELLGKSMEELFPSELAKSMTEDDKRIMREGKPIEVYEDFNGRHYLTHKFPISDGSTNAYLAGFTLDLTDRIEAERKLEASLKEKEVLYRELRHRVKNSLAIIMSLLDLEADSGKTGDYNKMKMRIRSVQALYEHLEAQEGVEVVELSSYLSRIVEAIAASYGDEASFIETELDVYTIKADKAVPLGLTVNELIMNSLKHAYGGKAGRVKLTLETKAEGAMIEVTDEGKGFPEHFVPEQSDSLGLLLSQHLIAQIGAKIEFESTSGKGLRVRVTIPD